MTVIYSEHRRAFTAQQNKKKVLIFENEPCVKTETLLINRSMTKFQANDKVFIIIPERNESCPKV